MLRWGRTLRPAMLDTSMLPIICKVLLVAELALVFYVPQRKSQRQGIPKSTLFCCQLHVISSEMRRKPVWKRSGGHQMPLQPYSESQVPFFKVQHMARASWPGTMDSTTHGSVAMPGNLASSWCYGPGLGQGPTLSIAAPLGYHIEPSRIAPLISPFTCPYKNATWGPAQ